MKYIAVVLLLAAIPLLVGWARQFDRNRRILLSALTLTLFLSGVVPTEASLVALPVWGGVVKGVPISIVDVVALALIFSRPRSTGGFPLSWVLVSYLTPIVLSFIPSRYALPTFFTLFQALRCAILFAAVVPEIGSLASARSMLAGLGMGLTVQSLYVVYQKATGVVQAHGTMVHQNFLGIMTELSVLPLVAALFAGERHPWVRIGAFSGLVIVASGGSRATVALTFGGLVVFAALSLVQGRSAAKSRILGLGLAFAMLCIPFAAITLHARFGQNSVLAEENQRGSMERAAESMAADYPLGVGANLYVMVANMEGYSVKSGVSWGGGNLAVPVHNAYLLARAETGWAGQLTFLMLFIVPIAAGLRHAFKFRTAYDGSLALGSAIGLAVVAIHSNYEFAACSYGAGALIFMNIAFISGSIRFRRRMGRDISRASRVNIKVANGRTPSTQA